MLHWSLSSVGLSGTPLLGLLGMGREATVGPRGSWLGDLPPFPFHRAAGSGEGPTETLLLPGEYVLEYGAKHPSPSTD